MQTLTNNTTPGQPGSPNIGEPNNNSNPQQDDDYMVRDFNTEARFFAMVFEDSYTKLDWDYNDIVVKFSVKEFYNASYQLKKIEILVYPRPFEAGFANALKLSPDGRINDMGAGADKNLLSVETKPLFNGPGTIEVSKFSGNSSCYSGRTFDKTEDVVIFPNQQTSAYTIGTSRANRCVYKVTVNVDDPSQNAMSDRPSFDITQYRFFVHVLNENRVIDLADVNPQFMLSGKPLGFFVPIDFAYPPPAQPIFNYYSWFDDYSTWLQNGRPTPVDQKIVEWYKYPNNNVRNQLVDAL